MPKNHLRWGMSLVCKPGNYIIANLYHYAGSKNLLPSKTQRTMAKKVKEDCGRSFGKFLGDMSTE